MNFNEADTRAKLIDPAIHRRGWTEDLVRREETAGRSGVRSILLAHPSPPSGMIRLMCGMYPHRGKEKGVYFSQPVLADRINRAVVPFILKRRFLVWPFITEKRKTC